MSLIESIRSSLIHPHGFQQLVPLPQFIEIAFFVCTRSINLLNLKQRSQARNRCKRVLKAAKRAYVNKAKESITSQIHGSRDFWRIANSVLHKGKSAIPPLLNGPEVLSSASDKAKLFAENLSKNYNLDDSGISFSVFPSRANLKQHSIYVTPKIVKKVILKLDLSKTFGPDCIPVLVLKNCEPDLSYILAELFKKCLKVSLMVYVFENVGE